MRFAWCPPGTFLMGSPADEPERSDDEDQHQVTLSKGFWISVMPATQAQWQAVMGDNPSYFKEPNLPVEQVTWDQCEGFCHRLSHVAGKPCRLPTEAEWECAYRAGTQTPFYFGADARHLGEYAWFAGNSGNQTHEVGQKKPNAWGLYDMAGNVWEWCADRSVPYSKEPIRDPNGGNVGDARVVRGGAWDVGSYGCRAACRDDGAPSSREYYVGCRLVLCQD
jgi:formylglycine-generating enzyme required for sulfatase activity